jgi:hypothetical protein
MEKGGSMAGRDDRDALFGLQQLCSVRLVYLLSGGSASLPERCDIIVVRDSWSLSGCANFHAISAKGGLYEVGPALVLFCRQ